MSRVPFAVSATGWPCLAVGAQRRGGARSHREHFSRWLAAVLMLAMLGFAREAFAQSWSLTGSINTARIYDTATLLPNGQALVAGGANSSDNYISSAELYNPASGTWSLTGSLNFDRAYHTATLLPNGQVLAAGGFGFVDGSPAIAIPSSAELYNPATGTWSVTGMLNVARYWHTATLLSNGQVLVAGGFGISGDVLSSAELYDPAAGTWSVTGSLNFARVWSTMTLLPNGQVLVAGGAGPLSSAELYNPATGTWSITGSLNVAREGDTATLLTNGQVLVAGGGGASDNALTSAELYNPVTGTWSVTGSLNFDNDTATLLTNGQVLVTAGGGTSAELYNPATGTWSLTASLNVARDNDTATLLSNGQVLVASGVGSSDNFLSSAELYNATTPVAAPALPPWATLLLTVGLLAIAGQGLQRQGVGRAHGL